MHQHDWIESIRHAILPKIGIVTQWLEDSIGGKYYMDSETHTNQFVGRVPMTEEEFEVVLDDLGFERNPLASWKSLKSGEEEEGSWRLVKEDSNMQLHVIIYDGSKQQNAGDSGYTYVYAHRELRWDTNPIGHLRKRRANGPKGVSQMKDLFDQNGIVYEPIRP